MELKIDDRLVVKPLKTDKSKIKINDYMRNHIIPIHPASALFCGRSGMGKTQLVLNLLNNRQMYKDYFDIIFLFSATAEAGDDLYQKHSGIPERNVFKPDAEGIAQLEHLFKTQQDTIKKKGISKSPKILLIFDDVAHARAFLESPAYLKLHIMNRHFNISTWSLTQSYVKIPRSCRCQVGAIFFFHGATDTEKKRLSQEHTPANLSEKQFVSMIEHATKKKFDFLFINKSAEMDERYRHCMHTILKLIQK